MRKRAATKAWTERNRDRVRANQRAWRARKKRENAQYHLQKTYGISPEQYGEMLRRQGGVCALCGVEPTEEKRLVVDHDHTTGCVRCLLCRNCNTALGKLGDNVAGLQRAIAYLEHSHGDE